MSYDLTGDELATVRSRAARTALLTAAASWERGEHTTLPHWWLRERAAALSGEWSPLHGTVEDDLRSRLACVLEASAWDRPYDERIAAIRGLCDMTTNGMTPQPSSLTIDEVVQQNRSRRSRWHGEDTEPWSGADWSNAMCGEAGEAANVVKKIRRHETGTANGRDGSREDLVVQLGDELADVVAYMVILADHYEIDLADAVARKFNAVSEREGYPERLPRREEPS